MILNNHKNTIIRVGLGQTTSGKILDRDAKSFVTPINAYNYALETGKPIFVSKNKQKYKQISLEELKEMTMK